LQRLFDVHSESRRFKSKNRAGNRAWNRKHKNLPADYQLSRHNQATLVDAVMDFEVTHKRRTVVALHLEQEMKDGKPVKIIDLRYWYVRKSDGVKQPGQGIRFELDPHAGQLGQRLIALFERHKSR
jgi:hypothetical protein